MLRQDRFFAGRPVHVDGTKDLAWFAPDGTEMTTSAGTTRALRTLQMYLHAVVPDGEGRHVDESLLSSSRGRHRLPVQLPGLALGGALPAAVGQRLRAPPGHRTGRRRRSSRWSVVVVEARHDPGLRRDAREASPSREDRGARPPDPRSRTFGIGPMCHDRWMGRGGQATAFVTSAELGGAGERPRRAAARGRVPERARARAAGPTPRTGAVPARSPRRAAAAP